SPPPQDAKAIFERNQRLMSDQSVLSSAARNWAALTDAWGKNVDSFFGEDLGLSDNAVGKYHSMAESRRAELADEMKTVVGRTPSQDELGAFAKKVAAIDEKYDRQLHELLGDSGYSRYVEYRDS